MSDNTGAAGANVQEKHHETTSTPKAGGTVVRHRFLDSAPRRQIVDWQVPAQHRVAQFRVNCARFAGDPHVNERIETLKQESALFERLWTKYEVRANLDGTKTIDHHAVGELELHHVSLGVIENPDMRIIVYVAEPGSETEAKLRSLLTPETTTAVAPR